MYIGSYYLSIVGYSGSFFVRYDLTRCSAGRNRNSATPESTTSAAYEARSLHLWSTGVYMF